MPAKLSGQPRIVPVLAWPVGHVKAPSTYNPAFAAQGLDWCHVPLGVRPEDLATTLAALTHIDNLQGVNLTLPHKAEGRRLCRWLTREARSTGMVNTLRLAADGSWAGTNSDGVGFVAAARRHGLLDVDRPVAMAGCGGAGTAIAIANACALAEAGVRELHLWDADAQRAAALHQQLAAQFEGLQLGTVPAHGIARAGLLVNASPMGLKAGEPLPMDLAGARPDAALFDIIAGRDTELMAQAHACKATPSC